MSSSAFHSVAAVARRMTSADVGPPSSIVAAWMIQRAGIRPAVVCTASPSPIGARRLLCSWTSGPPAREIAPATPPPCCSIVLAALAIASTSRVVMSVSRTSTMAAIARSIRARAGTDHAADQTVAQATSAGSSLPCRRSRPRCTAAMNFVRLTSSVLRISSA